MADKSRKRRKRGLGPTPGMPLRLTPDPRRSEPHRSLRSDAGNLDDHTTDDLLNAFSTMSRRINDLARELKCLGYFDDEDDRPRAA